MDANMTVIDIPARGPTITGRRDIYHVGDLLLLNCSSPYSFPPTTLSWHINGHLASRETVVVYPGETDSEGCEASWSGLQMRLHRDHFQEGVLILRCTASILHVYRLSTEVMITDSNYIESSPRESPSTGDAGCSSMLVLLLLLPLLLSTLGT
ncbi:uncharacterized protein LOC121870197 isoform X2 [Homarus americanus]|uniref:uncharacterized protein LOC121870197 isoform X2 n=1 Tax=Homarus americanus TaxID=6706 RepID=UPI001C451C43|nr:uncharacterized protein LOC121870197 isoform X2 [Homarus americanus]